MASRAHFTPAGGSSLPAPVGKSGRGSEGITDRGWGRHEQPFRPSGRWGVRALLSGVTLLALASPGWGACLTNPMLFGQDPHVAFKDGYYHLVQSDGCNLRMRRASSLGALASAANPVIYRVGCSNVWAPELHWLSNRWYLYYSVDTTTAGNERVHVAESSGANPAGPYTERGVLFSSYWNIDGNVLTAANGRLYFLCSGSPQGTQNLYIAPMATPRTLGGPLTLISSPTQPWELNGRVNEGPCGFVHAGRTFIVYSASGCWTDDYCLGLLTLTGTDPLDRNAWTKSGPVFVQQPGAYGPGHNCVLPDPSGQWWNLYHANVLSGQGCGNQRRLFAQRLTWTADAAPFFGLPTPPGSLVTEDPDYLVCHYPLEETGGRMARNLGCGPDAGLVGSPVWRGPGLALNGTTDFVDGGSLLGNDVQSTLTLAAWIQPVGFRDWAGLITKGTNVSPYALQTWGDGSLRFTANWGAPPGSVGGGSWNSTAKLRLGQWSHVAVTYDGTAIRFYLDGVMDASPSPVALRFGVAREPLTLGVDLPGGDEYFPGTMREVRIYGRALSATEVLQLAALNQAPTLAPTPDQRLLAGQTLVLTNRATDGDVPPQGLEFRLLRAPPTATLNPSNGVFTWRPAIAESPSSNPVTLAVCDAGVPRLCATQSFVVVVDRPALPELRAPVLRDGTFQFTVTGEVGPDYVIAVTTNLAPPRWTPWLTTNPAALPFTWFDGTAPDAPQRYYRVILGP